MTRKPATPAKEPRPTRNDAQRQAFLDAACVLFIEKGFGGTNINDIADAVGVSRTALYYYFPSKESMLAALTEEVTEKASRLAQTVSRRDAMPPDEALRQLILQHAGLILAHPLQFRVVERSESSLPEPHRTAAGAARRAVLDHFVRVIQRGIDGGQFRDTNAHFAAFAVIGMCNWCAWWFQPDGGMSAESVAAGIAEFGLRALASERGRAARPATVEDTVSQLRESLAALEKQLQSGRR
jgi:AcrR family transcriptional regulator